jgi:Lon protease-like protein
MSKAFRPASYRSSDWFEHDQQRIEMMEIPLFPLKNVVLFPGMVLPLHIFELRYREMIHRCSQEKIPFGVVLIKEGQEVSDATGQPVVPYTIGTLAKIIRVETLDDGCMNITTIGVERFMIQQIHQGQSYLTATVRTLPTSNGSTKVATELAQKMRPRLYQYVELLAKALQVSPNEKQTLLECAGVPEILVGELNLLAHESMLLRYMVETQAEMQTMNAGMTGGIFPN